MSEEKNILGELTTAFEEFKTANDARLEAIEKKGSADPLIEEKVNSINDAITDLSGKLSAVEKKAGRPAAEGEATDEDAEAYRKAFDGWARKGRGEDELSDLEKKAMAITTDSGNDGGHTVPAIVDLAVNNQLKALSAMRQLAKVVTVSSGNFSVLLNDRATASGWVDEDDARSATATPKLTKLAVNMGEVYANAAVTQQLLDDAGFDLESFLAQEIADEFAEAEGTAFITGNGTAKPMGILASGTGIATVNSGSDTAILSDSLITLVYSLKAGHRAGAAFIANATTMAAIRKLKSADTDQYLWAPGFGATPATLLGYPVYEDENMPDIAGDAEPVAFGNFAKGYIIADRLGIQMLRDPYTSKPNVIFYARKRVGGRVLDPVAIKLLTISDGA